jgi:hypothetical protein
MLLKIMTLEKVIIFIKFNATAYLYTTLSGSFMTILYLHGLESKLSPEKEKLLENLWVCSRPRHGC